MKLVSLSKLGTFFGWMAHFLLKNSEKTIFQNNAMTSLEEWELVECDTGLESNTKARLLAQALTANKRKEIALLWGRHDENANDRSNFWNVLCGTFHHNARRNRQEIFHKHGMSFVTFIVMSKIKFENKELLYNIKYDVHFSYSA